MCQTRRITENFWSHEFLCKCGRPECDAVLISDTFVLKLQQVRNIYGYPMFISSGSRCLFWNEHEGGTVKSAHLTGMAADIKVYSGFRRYELVAAGMIAGITGIGFSERFVHLDLDHIRPVLWTY